MSLQGKHALITGSSRGVGRGIALKSAAQGVPVSRKKQSLPARIHITASDMST